MNACPVRVTSFSTRKANYVCMIHVLGAWETLALVKYVWTYGESGDGLPIGYA
jgi:hypothetical protein